MSKPKDIKSAQPLPAIPEFSSTGVSCFEIKLFLGIAVAEKGNELGYPAGERHALIVFCRQLRGSKPDRKLARLAIQNTGWSGMEFLKASTIDLTSGDLNETTRLSYEDAMLRGSAVIVYSNPV